MLQAETQHRGHAIVEQVLPDWTSGPLAHLPSGSFAANAAWLACAAMTHNLLRAAGALASLAYARARGATLRRDLIDIAARIARHGRGHITMHLPERGHRRQEWMNLFQAATGPPAPRPDPPQPGHCTPQPQQATRDTPPLTRSPNPDKPQNRRAAGKPWPPERPDQPRRTAPGKTITRIYAVD